MKTKITLLMVEDYAPSDLELIIKHALHMAGLPEANITIEYPPDAEEEQE